MNGLKSIFKVFRGTRTQAEREAEALDDGVITGGYYTADERDIALFAGPLRYSQERKEWFARFVPAQPEQTADPSPDDASYPKVLRRAQILHDAHIKPSQSLKALAAFDALIDRQVGGLAGDFEAQSLQGPS